MDSDATCRAQAPLNQHEPLTTGHRRSPGGTPTMFEQLGKQALRQARMVKVMVASGVVRPYNPVPLAEVGKTILDWGIGFAVAIGALAVRSPDNVGLVDELGELTWSELDIRSTRLAHGLSGEGVAEGD